MSTLIFAVLVLFLNSFLDVKTHSVNRDDKLRLVDTQFNNYNNNTGEQAPNVDGIVTERLGQDYFDNPNVRPLVFITGAKLLSIFCSNIPFALIAFKYFHAVNGGLQDRSVCVTQCHLIALLTARLILGGLALSLTDRGEADRNLRYRLIPIRLILIAFGCNLILYGSIRYASGVIPLWNINHFVGWTIVSAYIICSIFIDAYGHMAAVSQWPCPLTKRPLAIAFATCIEHLVHVLFVVVYLTDVWNGALFLSTCMFILVSVCFQTAVGYARQSKTAIECNGFYYKNFKCELSLEIL